MPLTLHPRMVVGISGVARSGKNLFVTLSKEHLASNGYRAASFAFATLLKQEIDAELRARYGISAFTQDTKEKDVIRPALVELGQRRRAESKGRYWIDQLIPLVERAWGYYDVVMIEDVRYASHGTDESGWVKSLGGKVLHIQRVLENGEIVGPANREEEVNDPMVRAVADLPLMWPTLPLENATEGKKSLDNLRTIVHDAWENLRTV